LLINILIVDFFLAADAAVSNFERDFELRRRRRPHRATPLLPPQQRRRRDANTTPTRRAGTWILPGKESPQALFPLQFIDNI
jgi:hypothetical protein